ncbi:transposase [Nocardia sp. NPDC004168]|uniref:IS110 family transposase n=1 Tax=Nocardia sp. NPDC004168 TaxID=3154452 RepID=UPI0033A4C24B
MVAVDAVGRRLAAKTIGTASEDHLKAVKWARQWPDMRFALEDCRHVTRRFERDLLSVGLEVVRVPTHLMAAARRGGREKGKSDPIDALALAHAALPEPDPPTARLDGPAREMKLLSNYRHVLATERTELINRLRWHLHEIDPGLEIPARGLRRYCVIDDLAQRLTAFDGLVAELARARTARCRELIQQVNDLERQLRDRVRALAASLLSVPGCGVLSAAVIVGETAGAQRFRNKDGMRDPPGPRRSHCGRAPPRERYDSIAEAIVGSTAPCTCAHPDSWPRAGQGYVDKLVGRGKTCVGAMQLLRQCLSNVVFRPLVSDERAALEQSATVTKSLHCRQLDIGASGRTSSQNGVPGGRATARSRHPAVPRACHWGCRPPGTTSGSSGASRRVLALIVNSPPRSPTSTSRRAGPTVLRGCMSNCGSVSGSEWVANVWPG